jgi:hypothetical protein
VMAAGATLMLPAPVWSPSSWVLARAGIVPRGWCLQPWTLMRPGNDNRSSFWTAASGVLFLGPHHKPLLDHVAFAC